MCTAPRCADCCRLKQAVRHAFIITQPTRRTGCHARQQPACPVQPPCRCTRATTWPGPRATFGQQRWRCRPARRLSSRWAAAASCTVQYSYCNAMMRCGICPHMPPCCALLVAWPVPMCSCCTSACHGPASAAGWRVPFAPSSKHPAVRASAQRSDNCDAANFNFNTVLSFCGNRFSAAPSPAS